MCPWLKIFDKVIPGYGLCIVLGIVLSNILAYYRVDKEQRLDMFVLEGYSLLGGMLGAKVLYLLVSVKQIDWKQLSDITYAISILRGGFVFYGGLLGGMLGFYLATNNHKIQGVEILERVIFGVPLAHAFGRVGCFMAGCCYGVPYRGAFAVTYPAVSFGPSGVSCFPVQLLEAFLLLILSLVVYWASAHKRKLNSLGLYLIGYAVIRFIVEYLRGDVERGNIGMFSTSQWISIVLLCTVMCCVFLKKKINNQN